MNNDKNTTDTQSYFVNKMERGIPGSTLTNNNPQGPNESEWENKILEKGWSIGSSDIPGTAAQGFGNYVSSNSVKIVKVRKSGSDDITDVMMDNGDVVPISEAITMVKSGLIEGVGVDVDKDGREYVKISQTGTTNNNLDNFPTF